MAKESLYDFTYHTKEQCKLSGQLKPLNKKTQELCEKINDFSLEYNKIKTKLNDVKNAVNALSQCLEMIYKRKKTPCTCSEILRGGGQTFVDGIGKAIGPNYNKATLATAKIFSGKDTASMLDLAHGTNMNDKNYIKDVYHLKNWDDPAVASDKKYLKNKVSEQFKDYNFDINQIKGYFFKSNSEAVKSLIQNADFRKIIKSHKEDILKGKDFSAGFFKHDIGILYGNNWRNAVGKIDFKHPWRDKQGNLHIKMYDTFDFNKNEGNVFVRAGAQQMDAGNLKPFFTIHDIIIPSSELDKIFGWVSA